MTPYPRYCKDCKWFIKSVTQERFNMCKHPALNSVSATSLSSSDPGVSCFNERNQLFFGQCGIKGKLWEAKKEDAKDYKKENQSSDR